jgi:hypothetical protein
MRSHVFALLASVITLGFCSSGIAEEQEPKVIDPGPPPSDAIVLFDGRDLSQWQNDKGEPPRWKVEDGSMIVTRTGSISTRRSFGDCQLHVEWAAPAEVTGSAQARGNSGIIFQGRYEIQVLDSYNNKTYFNGQAGSVYSEHSPLVNASRKPGEWQVYDIIYHGPRFDGDGKLLKPGTFTILHNGVLVQDHVEIQGPTAQKPPHKYVPHPPREPLRLQDHKSPVRYRNIWLREL